MIISLVFKFDFSVYLRTLFFLLNCSFEWHWCQLFFIIATSHLCAFANKKAINASWSKKKKKKRTISWKFGPFLIVLGKEFCTINSTVSKLFGHTFIIKNFGKFIPVYWYVMVVQSPSCVCLFTTQWTAAYLASLPLTNSQSLPEFLSFASVIPSNNHVLCHPLLPSVFPSIRVFSNELAVCISIGASASALVLPMSIQGWFPLGWTGWISLQSRGLSRVFSNTTVQKHQFFSTLPSLWSSSHNRMWLLEKT